MIRKSRERGFTLMELLIVITIIGVLLALMVVNYYKVVNRAKETECRANQKTIEAARMYNLMSFGELGNSIDDLELVFSLIGFVAFGSVEELICPLGGTYKFDIGSSEVTCSIEGHN